MKPTRGLYRMLVAAGAAQLLVTCLPAWGQVAAQNGRALDANNRVGAGGYNDRVGTGTGGVSPNNIIYGNVTGGGQFRGPIRERDPGAFMGPTAGGLTDRFIAGSSAAPQPYQPAIDLSTPQPFFGVSRNAPPPIGSVREGFTGAYLGSTLTPQNELGYDDFNAANNWQSQRLGEATILGTRSNLVGPRPGEMYLQGQLESQNQQMQLSGSPLYGIQPLRAGDTTPSDTDVFSPNGPSSVLPGGNADRYRFDQAEIRRMRSELQGAAQQENGENQQTPGDQGFRQPLESPENRALSSRFQNTVGNNPGFSNNVAEAGQNAQRSLVVAPELQSSQYSELRRRLARFQNPQITAMEDQHDQQRARQAAAARGAGVATSQPTAGAPGLNIPSPSLLREPGMGTLNLPPVKVSSLATGVRAKGLHDLLSGAEDLMRQGKFQSALDRYGMAQEIAPNNPLIAVGRADAELGAGAYRQASTDLHAIFARDQATLMAQYDLSSWIPADRMNAIRKELADLSAKDPADEMPEFLLAYISYNTGDPQAAAQHLAEAKKRAAGRDPVLRLLQTDWKLSESQKPANSPPADLNK